MKTFQVVIGTNFGDECKGLMVDYLARNQDGYPLIVRFNGGAQASHTVETKDHRHAFSHFCSGTMARCNSYLAKKFIVNPILFKKEREELISKGILNDNHIIKIHPDCIVTFPYDMMLNQLKETLRDEKRHGSCGVGIFETIVRNRFIPCQITMGDLVAKRFSFRTTYDYFMEAISKFDIADELIKKYAKNYKMIKDRFLEDVEYLIKYSALYGNNILNNYEHVIFEGAQGLLLDMDNTEYFPNLTPSNTGMKNVLDIIKDFKYESGEVVYVTRCYMTRHGAGRFYTECAQPYKKIVDKTNIPNEFQHSIRFGLLDVDLLFKSINKDFPTDLPKVKKSLAVTCLNHIDDMTDILFWKDNMIQNGDMRTFIKALDSNWLNFYTNDGVLSQDTFKIAWRNS